MKLEVIFTAVTFAVRADGTRVTIPNEFVFRTSAARDSLQACEKAAETILKDVSFNLRRTLREDDRKKGVYLRVMEDLDRRAQEYRERRKAR